MKAKCFAYTLLASYALRHATRYAYYDIQIKWKEICYCNLIYIYKNILSYIQNYTKEVIFFK